MTIVTVTNNSIIDYVNIYSKGSSTSEGGINFNRELYNVKYDKNIHSPNFACKSKITKKQLLILIDYCNKNNYYSALNHNCVTIARDAWNKALNDNLICTDIPYSLYSSIVYSKSYFQLDLSSVVAEP